MIKFVNFRLLRFKDCLFLTRYRLETTSIVKSKFDSQEQWERKMKFYMKTYEDLFGITKLTEMQEKVIEVQFKLQDIQEKRRKVQEEVFIVQTKLQEMQDILHKTSMGDDMYISVVTQVRELLKEQKRLQDIFSLYDQTEREQQVTLALAINNSQDNERTYREKNKYLSLITGVIGGIVGLLGSSINNWRHRKDIKHFAHDISEQVVDLKSSVEKLNLVVSADGALLNVLSPMESTETEDLLSTIKSQQNILQDRIKSFQSVLNGGTISKRTINNEKIPNEHFDNVFNDFERNMESKLKHYAYVNLGLIGSSAVFSILFFLYIGRIG